MKNKQNLYALPQTLKLGDMEEQVHPAAVETENGLLLIDPGLPGNLDVLEEELGEHGFSLEDVEKILLTHQDFDHAGMLNEVLDETDATVFAHGEDAPAIDGREDPVKGDERYPAAHVDVELSGGETFQTEAGELEVYFTPGHTPGHLSLVVDDLLISGDNLNLEESGLGGPRERFTPEMERSLSSLYMTSFLEFKEVLCFHGGHAEAENERVREIAESGLEQYGGFSKSSGEVADRFLRRELPNSKVGLSRFVIDGGDSHGARDDPEKGHRHSRQAEIYFVEQGSGFVKIGNSTEEYSEGDAFLIQPYRLRRFDAEEETVLMAAGAPVDDAAEMRSF